MIARVVAVERLDLDDLGALVGQQLVQNGPGQHLGEVERSVERRSSAPASIGVALASLVAPVAAPLDQHRALALEDLLVVLVHAVVAEADDAGVLAARRRVVSSTSE